MPSPHSAQVRAPQNPFRICCAHPGWASTSSLPPAPPCSPYLPITWCISYSATEETNDDEEEEEGEEQGEEEEQ